MSLRSPIFADEKATLRYVATMVPCILLTLAVTVVVPYAYDQYNLNLYEKAYADQKLLLREDSGRFFDGIAAGDPRAKDNSEVEPLVGYRLISLDYVLQMNAAASLKTELESRSFRTFLFAAVVLLGSALGFCLAFHFLRNHVLRCPAVCILFLLPLIFLQVFGLPHNNLKFHTFFGWIYALLIVLSDFLDTLCLRLPKGPATNSPQLPGFISSLQHKHRFWNSVYTTAVAAILSLFLTVSFVAFDVFRSVFGEGFLIAPLVGVSIAAVNALLWGVFGVLFPIRRHLSRIEAEMATAGT